ncbi:MAG: hypothetical protein ACRBCJ_11225 [Hyphomicrobiaceae bacterium]
MLYYTSMSKNSSEAPTKDDPIAELTLAVTQGFKHIEQRFDALDQRFDGVDKHLNTLEAELRTIRSQLDHLAGQIDDMSGYAKEIDDLLHRVAAIEKHLGINKQTVS